NAALMPSCCEIRLRTRAPVISSCPLSTPPSSRPIITSTMAISINVKPFDRFLMVTSALSNEAGACRPTSVTSIPLLGRADFGPLKRLHREKRTRLESANESMSWIWMLRRNRDNGSDSRRILDGRVELSTCFAAKHGHADMFSRLFRQLVLGLLALLIGPLARAELTVYGGVEYFDWRESTTPSVTETGPLLLGGLIWQQDRDRGVLFGYRGEIYAGSV